VGQLRGTARQTQILELASQGQSDKEIAVALGISVHTVRSHLQRLYRTHGLTNRAEAVAAWASKDAAVTPAPPDEAFEEKLSAAAEMGAAARLGIQTSAAMAQLELVNHERESTGLTSLLWDDRLADVATISARQMAEQGYLGTVIGLVDGEDAPDVSAENVGYWPGMNDLQLHALFVADPKQRANILGPHRAVGAAWATTEAGVAFLSVVFG
jgi:DNA-binding CsgD family transcriptional regulator